MSDLAHLKVLAISGSLRAASRNTAALQALQVVAPETVKISLYADLANMPPFNPDCLVEDFPAVLGLADAIRAADIIVIASPEYAHGVSGVLKNALDWLVGTDVFVMKPVAQLNVAARAEFAYAALKETLTMMSVDWLAEASQLIPMHGQLQTTAELLADAQSQEQLSRICDSLLTAGKARKRGLVSDK